LFEIFIDQDTIGLKVLVVSEKIKMTEKNNNITCMVSIPSDVKAGLDVF
jgi:hypothetical protein